MAPPVVAEIGALLVRHLAELPRPSTLRLRVEGFEPEVWLTTSRRVASTPQPAVVLTPLEYELLAVALADGGRLSREEALWRLEEKCARPHVRWTRQRLLGPVRNPDPTGVHWTFGDLFRALRAELVGVDVHHQDEDLAEEGAA